MGDSDERRGEDAAAPRIEVQCLSCGRTGRFDEADERVSGSSLVQLTKRLRCSECGSRAIKATSVRTPRDLARALRDRMARRSS